MWGKRAATPFAKDSDARPDQFDATRQRLTDHRSELCIAIQDDGGHPADGDTVSGLMDAAACPSLSLQPECQFLFLSFQIPALFIPRGLQPVPLVDRYVALCGLQLLKP